jgi:hypothetical protein
MGWGESVVEVIARDLSAAFPGTTGFSPQNVWRMLQLYRTYTDAQFLSQLVREFPKDELIREQTETLSQRVRDLVAAVP